MSIRERLIVWLVLVLGTMLPARESNAQEYALQHLTTANGLPSNLVYNIIQDRRGYLWFCTDHGVARYNGNSFQSFTTSDGIPDNEVFALTEDDDGRIWLVTYTHEPCYILHDKVYSAANDRLCRDIARKDIRYTIVFRRSPGATLLSGNHMAVISGDSVRLIYENQHPVVRVQNYYRTAQSEIFICTDGVFTASGDSLVRRYAAPLLSGYLHGDSLYLFGKTGQLSTIHELSLSGDTLRRTAVRTFPLFVYGFAADDSGRMLMLTSGGIYDRHNGPGFQRVRHLPASLVSNRALVDRDGNTWFSTTDKGVFMKPRFCPRRYSMQDGLHSDNVISIRPDADHSLLAGCDNGWFTCISGAQRRSFAVPGPHHVNRIRFVIKLPGQADRFLTGCDLGLYMLEGGGRVRAFIPDAQKAAFHGASGPVLIAHASGAGAFDLRTGQFREIATQRTTAIAGDSSGIRYLGTLDGLYELRDTLRKIPLGKPSSRITSLSITGAQELVAGTHNDGIYVRNRTRLLHLNAEAGLSSDNCRKVYADPQGHIWVCSDKGLDELVPRAGDGYHIRHFAAERGLNIASVNDFAVDDRLVYLATTEGLFALDRHTAPVLPPPVYISWLRSRDSVYRDGSRIRLPYNHNDLQIAYSGISYQNGAQLQYRYLLRGAGIDTINTVQTVVNLSAIAPGDYEFLVWAGIAGTDSWNKTPARLQIHIATPFWQTWWTLAALLLLAAALTSLIYRLQIRRVRTKERDRNQRIRQMGQLKLQALRAQINPHFIFNALNAIQHYYSEHDERSANRFLSLFAKLVRATLINSKRDWLLLSEELEILTTYIRLEQMRFGNAFDFDVIVAENIEPAGIALPTMLIQPYVENAINHGLRHVTDRKGKLLLRFESVENAITCVIEDNGIGMEASTAFRSGDHKSVGMGLNQERIRNINQVYDTSINLSVLNRSAGTPGTGTRITIIIPQITPKAYAEHDYH